MNLTKKSFDLAKSQLISIFEKIYNSNLVPVEFNNNKITKEDINEMITDLKDEKFIVSVCGQVKAGKSTLLNALIFDDEILPSASVPATAKLTELKYGENPKYEVHFYSKKEWEQIKNTAVINNETNEETNFFDKFIKSDIEKLINSGELGVNFETKYIDKDPIEGTNLKELNHYISKDGRYTHFVKKTIIYYPSEFLKEIIIVDTPGINDPNPVRSKITEEWINKSDAIIYLIYAGRPFDKEDKEFMNQFFINVDREKILIVLSKIDSCSNLKDVENYVFNTIIKELGEMGRQLFSNKKLYKIAPLFYLYKKIYEKYGDSLEQKKLEDISYQLGERVENEPQFQEIVEKSEEYLNNLKDGIYEYIIKNKGYGILNSKLNKIIGIKELNILKISENISKKESELEALALDLEKIERELKKIEETKLELEKFKKEITNELEIEIKEFKNKFYKFINSEFKSLQNKIESYINTRDIDSIKNELPWFLKDIFENFIIYNLSEFCKRESKKLSDIFKDKKNKIINKLGEKDIETIKLQLNFLLHSKVVIDTIEISDILKKEIEKNINMRVIQNEIAKKWIIFIDDEKTKSNLKNQLIRNIFKKIKNSLLESDILGIIEYFYNKLSELEILLYEVLSSSENILNKSKKLQGNIEQKTKIKENLNKEIERLKKEREKIENFFQELKLEEIEKILN